MNDLKKQKLFEAARRESAIEAPSNFPALVVAAVRRESPMGYAPSVMDALVALFPRVATAAMLIIAVSVAADFYFGGDMDYAAVTEQWFFGAE